MATLSSCATACKLTVSRKEQAPVTLHVKEILSKYEHDAYTVDGQQTQVFILFVHPDEPWHKSEEKTVFGVEGNSTLLSCVPRSLHAKVLWFRQRGDDKQEVSVVRRVAQGIVLCK